MTLWALWGVTRSHAKTLRLLIGELSKLEWGDLLLEEARPFAPATYTDSEVLFGHEQSNGGERGIRTPGAY
jgi:hypothetical protein